MKNYYQTLGVLDNAEDIVIRAAYKALAQRYHPDKWAGDPAEATRRMAEINEAYGVLSDPGKRRAYDEHNNGQQDLGDAESGATFKAEYTSEEEEAWAMAAEFFPHVQIAFQDLRRISPLLANTFRLYILESKEFARAKSIAQTMEKNHLSRFYGDDPLIQAYARRLLFEGHYEAAIEVNKIVRFMGSAVPYPQVKANVERKFPGSRPKTEVEPTSAARLANLLELAKRGDISTTGAAVLIKHFFGNEPKDEWLEAGLFSENRRITFLAGDQKMVFTSARKYLNYVQELALTKASGKSTGSR